MFREKQHRHREESFEIDEQKAKQTEPIKSGREERRERRKQQRKNRKN